MPYLLTSSVSSCSFYLPPLSLPLLISSFCHQKLALDCSGGEALDRARQQSAWLDISDPEMSSSESLRYGFATDKDFSWAIYDEHRSVYPPSLWSLIMSYHETHHPNFTSALDLGCGSGAASTTLANHFSHLELADVAQHNIAAANTKLESPDFKATLAHECTFKFHVSRAEDEVVEPETQDMVTMFEALHWCDSAAVMSQAALALKPGGTLALVVYAIPTILDNAPAQEIWNDIRRELYHSAVDMADSDPAKMAITSGVLQSNTGLDFAMLEPKFWKANAQRITIDCVRKGSVALQTFEGTDAFRAGTHVDDREEVEQMNLPEWGKTVKHIFFRAWVTETLQLTPKVMDTFAERTGKLWEDLAKALAEGDGEETRVVFPAAVVLATKDQAAPLVEERSGDDNNRGDW